MNTKQKIFFAALLVAGALASFLLVSTWTRTWADWSVETTIVKIGLTLLWLMLTGLFYFFTPQTALGLIFAFLVPLPIFLIEINLLFSLAYLLLWAGLLKLYFSTRPSANFVKSSPAARLMGLGSTLTFLILALSLLNLAYAQNQTGPFKFQIPDAVFTPLYKSLTQNLGLGDSQALIEQNFTAQLPAIRQQLIAQGVDDEATLNEQIAKARRQYLLEAQKRLDNNDLADPQTIKTMAERQLEAILKPYQKYRPYLSAASLYLTLNFFSWPILLAGKFLIQIVVSLMLKLGLAQKTKQTIEVETISLG